MLSYGCATADWIELVCCTLILILCPTIIRDTPSAEMCMPWPLQMNVRGGSDRAVHGTNMEMEMESSASIITFTAILSSLFFPFLPSCLWCMCVELLLPAPALFTDALLFYYSSVLHRQLSYQLKEITSIILAEEFINF